MKINKNNQNNKSLKKIIIASILVIIIIYLFSGDKKETPANHHKKNNKSQGLFTKVTSIFSKDDDMEKDLNKTDDIVKIDKRLKSVKIDEIEVTDPEDEKVSPEKEKIMHMLVILTEPLDSLIFKFNSFQYSGNMRVTMPTINSSKKEFKKGNKFGKDEIIESNFLIKKDKFGNYMIYQSTKCTKTDTKYNRNLYNGTLYYIDGNFHFVDKSGERGDEDTVNAILSTRRRDRNEPLVRKNWIQIIRDLNLIIDFEKTDETYYKKSSIPDDTLKYYRIIQINKHLQKTTIGIINLNSEFSVLSSSETMMDAEINGEVVYNMGFLKGAKSNYRIELKIDSIDDTEEITLP